MAEKERLRLRQTFAELLSPSAASQTARGTLTVHDEPAVGGSVKGDAGQDGSSTEGPADGAERGRPFPCGMGARCGARERCLLDWGGLSNPKNAKRPVW